MVRSPDLPQSSKSADRSVIELSAEALGALRSDMVRFARLQLRNADAAEDLVQESIEAALRQASTFAGQSTLKTWVFAILRNRIIDHLRSARRSVPMSSLVEDGDDWQERMDALFNEAGGWREGARPATWPSPEESMQTRQFWKVFEACLDHLPPNTGRVFMMREFLGLETAEICSQQGISSGNCHVLLHRARLRLRDCMAAGWGISESCKC
ncbi:MAG: sigma-70 family RNA polymerase sigma factor [Burkholderiales bacterium]|nr:sigma-70 family RNA polymerase sigma factor [Burkholderiales bacterium]